MKFSKYLVSDGVFFTFSMHTLRQTQQDSYCGKDFLYFEFFFFSGYRLYSKNYVKNQTVYSSFLLKSDCLKIDR